MNFALLHRPADEICKNDGAGHIRKRLIVDKGHAFGNIDRSIRCACKCHICDRCDPFRNMDLGDRPFFARHDGIKSCKSPVGDFCERCAPEGAWKRDRSDGKIVRIIQTDRITAVIQLCRREIVKVCDVADAAVLCAVKIMCANGIIYFDSANRTGTPMICFVGIIFCAGCVGRQLAVRLTAYFADRLFQAGRRSACVRGHGDRDRLAAEFLAAHRAVHDGVVRAVRLARRAGCTKCAVARDIFLYIKTIKKTYKY